MGVIVARPNSSGQQTIKEHAVGDIDGVNVDFETTKVYHPDSLTAFYRGLREANITPLGGKQFRMPLPPRIGSSLWVEYTEW